MKTGVDGQEGGWKHSCFQGQGGDLPLNVMALIVCLHLCQKQSVTDIHRVSNPTSYLKEGQEQVNFKNHPLISISILIPLAQTPSPHFWAVSLTGQLVFLICVLPFYLEHHMETKLAILLLSSKTLNG